MQIVRDLYHLIDFEATVETGSFRGHSTQFLSALTPNPVLAVEKNSRFHDFARRRLAGASNVTVTLGDSRPFVDQVLARFDGPLFFYLDAHWYLDLPLVDEVTRIAASKVPAVVMIDDFEVPGDPDYRFDDYGPAGRLDLELLAPCMIDGWGRFFPRVPGNAETGLRRGCVVLASPSLVDLVSKVDGLRRYEATAS